MTSFLEKAARTVSRAVQGEGTVSEPTPFVDALRIPPRLAPSDEEALEGVTVELRATSVRLHSELPPTTVWAYDGQFPGPTFDVRRGQRLRVSWTNHITGDYPVTAVQAPSRDGEPPPTNEPGPGADAEVVEGVSDLPPWTVTHVHGAVTGGGNDGWAQNAVLPGDSMVAEYPNNHPRAMTLWYHDHAMDITRWNVYTGLVGMYLLRDDEEDALGLPSGDHEVPLILSDRNLDTDDDGNLTGDLLHKSQIVDEDDDGENVTLPFVGPYTLVNGVIWPYFEVEARWYRFRLLNASNARTYQLVLIDDETGEPVTGVVKQIGTEGGLLGEPVDVDDPLVVASAERLDLLVDFAQLRGRTLRLVNTTDDVDPGEPDPDGDVPYPQVMQFRVGTADVDDDFEMPPVLSPSFERITHDNAPEHGHRMIVLTPPNTLGGGGHPEIWEMREVDADDVEIPSDGVIQVRDSEGEVHTYQRISRAFDDALGFLVALDDWEQWSFLNLADPQPMHPMHIHLITFQALGRESYDVAGFDPQTGGTTAPVTYTGDAPIDPTEEGWKDTIRAQGAQLTNVIGPFEGATGRFMYHCHLLEHEDMGMMLPFVVMPEEVMVFSHHDGGGHDHQG